MLRDYSVLGEALPLTVLQVPDCQVVQVKTMRKEGFYALQLGAGEKKLKRVTKPMMGHFARANVDPKRVLMEFPVTKRALLPVGTTVYARHFIPGQFVDVCGVTVGKGFQGGMKRWGFKGLPATHGVSLAHRSIGSTGCRQDPGRVFKGKKMPGRMGNDRRTTLNLLVYAIDPRLNLLFVKGAVPGSKGGWVRVRDSIGGNYWRWPAPPPFPTYFPKPGEIQPEQLVYNYSNFKRISASNAEGAAGEQKEKASKKSKQGEEESKPKKNK